jgi:hypothetical protein
MRNLNLEEKIKSIEAVEDLRKLILDSVEDKLLDIKTNPLKSGKEFITGIILIDIDIDPGDRYLDLALELAEKDIIILYSEKKLQIDYTNVELYKSYRGFQRNLSNNLSKLDSKFQNSTRDEVQLIEFEVNECDIEFYKLIFSHLDIIDHIEIKGR